MEIIVRTTHLLAGALTLPIIAFAQTSTSGPSMSTQRYSLQALSPVLIVEAVEPSLKFWTEQLGFAKENEVPGPDGKLIFASVRKDGVEIMYQTRGSVIADNPAVAAELNGRSVSLFITVPTIADLDEIACRSKSAPLVKPRHDTFYGTTEFYIREPGGNVVGFAAPKS
jgi:uncharacterized glyoxalase superfamily protein PhnB